MNWKRHAIRLSQTVLRNLIQVFESQIMGIHICAMKCQNHEHCLTFSLDEKNGTCTGYHSQIYQGDKAALSTLEDSLYFINLCKNNIIGI